MLTVYLNNGAEKRLRVTEVFCPISGQKLVEKLTHVIGIESVDNFFIKNNGRLVELNNIVYNGDLYLEPKLHGGKGGFGSMLRAIGAQIEKTTNREACRDLSGRRLRDINEEKRLKAWIEKQAERNKEAAERKRRKLEKLRAEPKHEFKDKSYEEQRSALTERVEDAVEVGFAVASSSNLKRAADEKVNTNLKKKRKTILDSDDDIDSDNLESSDDSADEKETTEKQKDSCKIDNENSSDNGSNPQESNSEEDKCRSENESLESSKGSLDNASR